MSGSVSRHHPIPTFRIDLALAPEHRYVAVANALRPNLQKLGHIFDELLRVMLGSKWRASLAKFAARLFLRRVHDEEQMREITGFVKVAGVDTYLVVALNVFLDVMMSCTAGCVPVRARRGGDDTLSDSLQHFRTLDWGLDPLREILVTLEYIDSSKDANHVIATSVTYAGFVGVLTGVKQNLSVSLNYRPVHLCDNLALKRHQLLVILGFRPSIASVLRSMLLARKADAYVQATPLVQQAKLLAAVPTSPCYLTLCDGRKGIVIEKDLVSGRMRTADNFIVQTNHDSCHATPCMRSPSGPDDDAKIKAPHPEVWMQDSSERMDIILQKWIEHSGQDGASVSRPRDATEQAWDRPAAPVNEETLWEWMRHRKISNIFTHFACILDPLTGKVRWLERGPTAAARPSR